MAEHDNSYKLLFSHQEMVRDLLLGFVKEEWVRELDLDTLDRVNGSYVSDDIRGRHDDIVWRVKWGKEWLYIYILIEFQSDIDPYMPLRTLVYVGLLYQDLIREKKLTASGKLPPVLPLVLYNGKRRWTAPIEMSDLIEPVGGGLSRYRPQFTFFLLEEAAYSDETLKPLKNVVSALFRLETSRDPEVILEIVSSLSEWLSAPAQASLRRAFTVWFNRVFFPSRRRKEEQEPPEIQELTEVRTMLAETVAEWKEEWKREGWQEGREEGREEGRQQWGSNILLKQLELKFGKLKLKDRERVEAADSQTLLKWSEKILTAASVEKVFE